MNSYIKLKNGVIINLSQIETIGPLVPFNLTDSGIFANDDKDDFITGKFDLGLTIAESSGDDIQKLSESIFCVPTDSCVNDCYDMIKPHGFNFVPQQYMVLLKSGRIILLTSDEYDDIVDIMGFNDENYANVDKKYCSYE